MKFKMLFLVLTAVLSLILPTFAQEIRIVYFQPQGIGPVNPNRVDEQLDILITKVRRLFLDQMGKTFEFEKEDGKAKVHHFFGKEGTAAYLRESRDEYGKKVENIDVEKIRDEISKSEHYLATEISGYLYLIAADLTQFKPSGVPRKHCGSANYFVKQPWWRFWEDPIDRQWVVIDASKTCLQSVNNESVWITAHELGHAFGLQHDFVRNSSHSYIMSYGRNPHPNGPFSPPTQLSECSKKWLKASRYFNHPHLMWRPSDQEAEILLNSNFYSPVKENLRLEFTVTDADGLHAAQLFFGNKIVLFDCWSLNGPSERIEFDTETVRLTGRTQLKVDSDLYDLIKNEVRLQVIDSHGYITRKKFSLPESPDLMIESISVSKSTLVPGERFTLSATVRNIGTARSRSGILRYYEELGEAGSRNIRRLFPDQTMDMSIQLKAPEELGVYSYDACVSKVRDEVNKDNNCSTRITITVREPVNEVPIVSDPIPDVSVVNRAPVTVDVMPPQTLSTNGSAVRLDLSNYFEDADGDTLTYTTTSDNPNVAFLQVVGDQVDILPFGTVGRANVTVTASDGSATATQRFSVTVTAAPVANKAPVIVVVIPDQTLSSNGSIVRLDLSNYFWDADGDTLTYTTTVDNPDVALLQVIGTHVSIYPLSAIGSANVRVKASDGSLTATQSFRIMVQAAPRVNQPPAAIGTIAVPTLTPNGAVRQVNVSNYFRDSDGDSLTYTASSDDMRVVTANMSADYLTLTPVRAGSATVTVTASDGSLIATQHFTVEVQSKQPTQPVNQPPAAIGTIAPQTLTVNDAARRVNISGYFRDSDGDRLTYTARSDNTNVARVSVSGSEVTITPQRAGNTTLHVTASDGSLEATQSISVTVASAPPVPDPASFDLAIQSVTVSKDLLVPGESFTLSITIYNNGPGTSEAPFLSYYYSLIQGRTPEDQIHREGTVQLASLASGANITKSFTLTAPSTPKTYYYGAWLSGITKDTNLYNDVTTEVGVTVTSNPVQTPDLPDLVVESARVSKSALKPGERFTFYATVRNQGTDPAARTTLRYYRSADSTISKSDTEEDSDSIRKSLNPDQTSEEWDGLRAPNTPGTYYYGACVDSVPNEGNTDNNCSDAIAVTVYAPGPPDLIVENPRVDKSTLDPGERFKFYATVRNQGTGDADSTTLYYNRSNDSNISENDTNERWDSVSSLEPNETGDEWATLTAPDSPGTYYYGACVKSVTDERNTSNNCSRAIRITVEATVPDLVVESIRSSDTTVEVGEDFTLYATVRNQGSGDARRTTLRYYRSSDSTISDADTEEDDTDSVSSLDANETGNERVTLTAPNRSGVYYYGACVDSVTDESNTRNNCSTAIKITVAGAIIVRPPPGLQVGDSIVVQNSKGGGLNGLVVRSGPGIGFEHIISAFDGATGTITDGPEDNNGYTWWKVRWDRSDQVFCDVNPCVGWAIEFFRGTRVIAKDDALAAPLLNAVIPTETVLLSNYPNPFNPETWIPYQLSEPANVTVSIYSVDGKLVRRLALGHQNAGIYQSKGRAAYWDGRNEFGERVASGLYFYRFTAGDFTATRKMLIRK